jgi:uncharacterized protein (DUF302 family)
LCRKLSENTGKIGDSAPGPEAGSRFLRANGRPAPHPAKPGSHPTGMQTTYTVQHNEHITTRSFDEVIQALEAATGSVEGESWRQIAGSAKTPEDFEALVRSREGSSGFMRFLTVDHGWMSRFGSPMRSRMYTIGNPLIARTMLRHSVAAGLNVPIRLLIHEDAESGTTRIAYDLPSSLMSVLNHPEVTAAALKLDAKLIALAVQVSGSPADAAAPSLEKQAKKAG